MIEDCLVVWVVEGVDCVVDVMIVEKSESMGYRE